MKKMKYIKEYIDWDDWEEIDDDNYIIILCCGEFNYAGIIINNGFCYRVLLLGGGEYGINIFNDYIDNMDSIFIDGYREKEYIIDDFEKIGNVIKLGYDVKKSELGNYVCTDKDFIKRIKNKNFE